MKPGQAAWTEMMRSVGSGGSGGGGQIYIHIYIHTWNQGLDQQRGVAMSSKPGKGGVACSWCWETCDKRTTRKRRVDPPLEAALDPARGGCAAGGGRERSGTVLRTAAPCAAMTPPRALESKRGRAGQILPGLGANCVLAFESHSPWVRRAVHSRQVL